MYVCIHVYCIDSRKSCKFFFLKVCSFYTHYTLSVPPDQPLATGSGSTLEAGASCAPSGISIGRRDIVVVCKPYIRSYVSALLYRWDFGLGNRTRDMLPIFWEQFSVGSEPPGVRKTLRKIHWCWPGFELGRLISSLTLYPLCHRAPLYIYIKVYIQYIRKAI